MRKILFVFVAMVLFVSSNVFAGDVTLTTYYPAPFGMYQEMRVMGNLGVGSTNPASKVDIATGSNVSGLRLRGVVENAEIGDIYMGSGGQMIFSTKNGTDSSRYIDLRPEDNAYGVIIRESDGTSTTPYANLYVVDAVDDYFSINVNSVTDGDALVVAASNNIGIGTVAPAYSLQVGTPTFSNTPSASSVDASSPPPNIAVAIKNDLWVDGRIFSEGGGEWTRDSTHGFLYPTALTDRVGIGTSGPVSELDVAGGIISLNGGKINNDGDAVDKGISITNDSYIGINKSNPQASVHIGAHSAGGFQTETVVSLIVDGTTAILGHEVIGTPASQRNLYVNGFIQPSTNVNNTCTASLAGAIRVSQPPVGGGTHCPLEVCFSGSQAFSPSGWSWKDVCEYVTYSGGQPPDPIGVGTGNLFNFND